MRFQIFVYMFVPYTPEHRKKGDDDSRHIPSKMETASRNRF